MDINLNCNFEQISVNTGKMISFVAQSAFIKLGAFLTNYLNDECQVIGSLNALDYQNLKGKCVLANESNPWFTEKNINYALRQWANILTENNIGKWLKPYDAFSGNIHESVIGVVLAGNLPIVGFHDFLSVVMSGNKFLGKLSSSDKHLLPAIADILIKIEPKLKTKIIFTEERLKNFDAIIATGSNNSARYFEYYFGKYPHIIRKNRNGIAVLTGEEHHLDLLVEDIFRYFGLGCRNVSKLYVPRAYNFDSLFESMRAFEWVRNHHKYRNNYDYNKSILLVNNVSHFDNGFVLLKEDTSISSPISVVFFEYYKDIQKLNLQLEKRKEEIQCIVSEDCRVNNNLAPGQTQRPNLWDYADGVDTMEFLMTLPSKK